MMECLFACLFAFNACSQTPFAVVAPEAAAYLSQPGHPSLQKSYRVFTRKRAKAKRLRYATRLQSFPRPRRHLFATVPQKTTNSQGGQFRISHEHPARQSQIQALTRSFTFSSLSIDLVAHHDPRSADYFPRPLGLIYLLCSLPRAHSSSSSRPEGNSPSAPLLGSHFFRRFAPLPSRLGRLHFQRCPRGAQGADGGD